jgi:hypothetical protein
MLKYLDGVVNDSSNKGTVNRSEVATRLPS